MLTFIVKKGDSQPVTGILTGAFQVDVSDCRDLWKECTLLPFHRVDDPKDLIFLPRTSLSRARA